LWHRLGLAHRVLKIWREIFPENPHLEKKLFRLPKKKST